MTDEQNTEETQVEGQSLKAGYRNAAAAGEENPEVEGQVARCGASDDEPEVEGQSIKING